MKRNFLLLLFCVLLTVLLLGCKAEAESGTFTVIQNLDDDNDIVIEYAGVLYEQSMIDYDGTSVEGVKIFHLPKGVVADTVSYDAYLEENKIYLRASARDRFFGAASFVLIKTNETEEI